MSKLINIIEFYESIYNKMALEIAQHTPQLFSKKKCNSRLPPIADSSAVLLTVDKRFFLITAGHVISGDDQDHIGIMIGRDFCVISGLVKCFDFNDLITYDPNKVDLAIFQLDAETINSVKEKYNFFGMV